MKPTAEIFIESLNRFTSCLACNDDSYNEPLLHKLSKAIEPYADAYIAFQMAIWASPIVDSKDARLMAIYTSADELERGRRTVGKPGKLLRKIAPMATDADCAKFAEVFKDNFVTPLQGLVVKSGNKPEDFARVYTQKQAPKSDPRLGAEFKSLSASCMRLFI